MSFIGCGVMAEAIIAGLLRRELVTSSQIMGSHPRSVRREELQTKYGIGVVESNAEAAVFGKAKASDDRARKRSIVILAVKPQRLNTILSEVRGHLEEEQLVLSIVAGAKIETIVSELGHPPVVRAMPNTPAQIGQGMTAWTATPQVSEAQTAQVRGLLGALGKEMYVETERMIDMATALSATGPTYIFLVMEALVDAGCAEICVDEPSMSCYAYREDPARLVDILNRTVSAIRGRCRLSTHLCFGNYKARAVAPRKYAPMFPAFLDLHVDEMHLEMASREFAEIGLIRTIAQKLDVAVGIVDVKSYYIETPEDVAARVRRCLEFAPAERLSFAPDCGLSQTARWAAKRKLAAMVEGVKQVR